MEDINNEIILIEAPEGATFVGTFLNTLPIGILNKKRTGCGATSVALENEEDAIICCPTKQLINNKVSQYPNLRCSYELFGVMGGVFRDGILNYITTCREKSQPVKIMVTYDSFPKIQEAIGEDILNYKIIVDEYQELLDACVYREQSILNLLRLLRDLPNVTYLSATPIPFRFRPDELRGLNEYEIVWKDNIMVAPHRFKTDKPYALVVNMIQKHKQGLPLEVGGNRVEEYYFFLNSVRAIKDIIDKTGLTNDEVKVICADKIENRRKLGDISISEVSDTNKPFTFCTKTVFCGADFHSNSGLTIVISSHVNKNTMLDIATDIQQIAGRIRTQDNPFKNIVLHIFSTGLSCQTQIEFNTWLNERIESAQHIIDAYNNLTDDNQRKAIVARIKLNDKDELALYDNETNEVRLNTLKVNHFRYKFESIDSVYRNGISIRDAYLRAGCDLSVAQQWEQVISDYTYRMNGSPSFEVLYEEYLIEKERTRNWGGISDRIREIEAMNPLISLAYQYLTPDKVRALRYNTTDVKNEVHFESPDTQTALKSALRELFIEGGAYTDSDAKLLYQDTLDRLLIKKTAKASELKERYFEVADTKINADGKRKNGFRVLSAILLVFGFDKLNENVDKDSKSSIIQKTKKKILSFFSVK